jgi:hypothetical protein
MRKFFIPFVLFLLFNSTLDSFAQNKSIRTNGGLLNLIENTNPEISFGFQNYGSTLDSVWQGENGIVETVSQIMDRDKSIEYLPGKIIFREEFESERKELPENHTFDVSSWPNLNADYNPVSPNLNPQTVGISFLGTQISDGPGYIPPDCMGDIGPTQIMVAANGRIKVFNKDGSLGPLDADMDNFFNSVRNGIETSDPHIRYDRLSQRWFINIINVANTNNRILIAVSSGPVISSSSSFTFFYFQHNTVSPAGDNNRFADYPTLGVDKNALYIGVNMFTTAGNYARSNGFVVRKSSILGAGPIVVSAFRGLATTTAAGPYSPQGVNNDDPNSTAGYFIGVDVLTYSLLQIRRVSNPGTIPTISGNITLTVPTTVATQGVNALGTSTLLDALDDRLLAAEIRTNKNTGLQSLWTAHSFEVNSSGVGNTTGNRDGCRWYEIRGFSSTPTLYQSGTLYDPAATDPRFFWMPSVAANGQGHMVLGASTAGIGRYAEIVTAGRLVSDPLGTTQSFTLAQTSSTPYDITVTNPQRWGDYSQTVVDPNDDMTVWTFQEYCNTANSWGVRAIQLLAPPPANPTACVPGQVESQQTVNIVVNGTSTNGSGFFDPGADVGGPGFLNHISASIPNVTVNSVTYNNPTQITLNLTIGAVTPGLYNVTITNPDGQSTTSVGILQIDDPVPVELTSFSAATIGKNVKLSWNTATEINNYGFEVERSVVKGEWDKIGFVNGNGNSNSPKDYYFVDDNLPADRQGVTTGKYSYRLKQIDNDGQFEYSKTIEVDMNGVKKYELTQNYPNPFNPTTTISYILPQAGMVRLTLYNILGQEIRTLVNEVKEAGTHSINFNASDLNSGVYVYKIESGSFTQTKKMTLVK